VDFTHSSGAFAGGDKGVHIFSVNNVALGIFMIGTPANSAKRLIADRGYVLIPLLLIRIDVPFLLLRDLAIIFNLNIIKLNQATRPSKFALLAFPWVDIHLVINVSYTQPHTPKFNH